MDIALIYNQFYSYNGNELKIGGVETYMRYLSYLILKMQHKPIIFQLSESDFIKEYNGIKIFGFACKNVKELYCKALENISNPSVIIFMSDQFSFKVKHSHRVLLIQHGISWDKPYTNGCQLANYLKRFKMIIRAILDFNHAKNRVCVDYNFYNWYKTFCANHIPQHINIIPNFAEKVISKNDLLLKVNKSNEIIKIIFARRFYDYRGSLLFAKVMRNILIQHSNIQLTIAGEGPCENEMRNILKDFTCVDFITYSPEDSYKIHLDKDIAVIPTIGSEGTSLSLLEAMGAGCLVVSTPIGGMSNIVIDGYNGLMSMPNEGSLEKTINKAIANIKDYNIRFNAVETIRNSFSLKNWENQWKEVLIDIMEN